MMTDSMQGQAIRLSKMTRHCRIAFRMSMKRLQLNVFQCPNMVFWDIGGSPVRYLFAFVNERSPKRSGKGRRRLHESVRHALTPLIRPVVRL